MISCFKLSFCINKERNKRRVSEFCPFLTNELYLVASRRPLVSDDGTLGITVL